MKITDRRTGKSQTLKSLVEKHTASATIPFMRGGQLYLYFSGVGNLPPAPRNSFHVLNVSISLIETVSVDVMVDAVHAEIVLTEPSAV